MPETWDAWNILRDDGCRRRGRPAHRGSRALRRRPGIRLVGSRQSRHLVHGPRRTGPVWQPENADEGFDPYGFGNWVYVNSSLQSGPPATAGAGPPSTAVPGSTSADSAGAGRRTIVSAAGGALAAGLEASSSSDTFRHASHRLSGPTPARCTPEADHLRYVARTARALLFNAEARPRSPAGFLTPLPVIAPPVRAQRKLRRLRHCCVTFPVSAIHPPTHPRPYRFPNDRSQRLPAMGPAIASRHRASAHAGRRTPTRSCPGADHPRVPTAKQCSRSFCLPPCGLSSLRTRRTLLRPIAQLPLRRPPRPATRLPTLTAPACPTQVAQLRLVAGRAPPSAPESRPPLAPVSPGSPANSPKPAPSHTLPKRRLFSSVLRFCANACFRNESNPAASTSSS